MACSAVSQGMVKPPGKDNPRPSLRSITKTSSPFLITQTEAHSGPKIGMREYTATQVRDSAKKRARLMRWNAVGGTDGMERIRTGAGWIANARRRRFSAAQAT